MGNGSHGVRIAGGARDNLVGPQGNRIAFNAGDGVRVTGDASTGNRLDLNEIFANAGLGVDLAVRKRAGRVHGELSVFWNGIEDYIYDRDTGLVDPDEGLPIFRFTQDDAEFRGAEAEMHVELLHTEPHHLGVEVRGD